MFEPTAARGDQVVMDLPTDNSNTAVSIPEGGFALLGHTAQNASLTNAVTALAFDPYEELLWSGNTASRVVSYYGTQLDKYTAFVPSQSDIRSMAVTETLVLSLTAHKLHAHRRQGLPLFSHASEHMTDLTCMHRLSEAPHTMLLGGDQPKIVQIDLETQKETRIAHLKQKNCLGIRSTPKFLFSSDSDGYITLRHASTIDAISQLQAHQGAVADFDVHGNKLITCGYSPRMGALSGDRFVMVYDLRTLRPLPIVALPIAPSFCRFLPSYSDNRIMVSSQSGELIIMDLNDTSSPQIPIQLDTNGFGVFSIDISPSRQCIAFGDQTGFIHLFSDRAQPVFNDSAWETEFADPVVMHPAMGIDDLLPPFAVFPLPFSVDEGYLSDWPEQSCQRFYRQPDPVPEQTLDAMRMVQFVGYAPNPRADTALRNFNLHPYQGSAAHRTNTTIEQPAKETSPQSIPKFYRRVHVRPSRYNNEEFDYLRYNRTELIPIDTQTSMPQASAVLLALFHIPAVRAVFLKHLCYEVDCLSCEVAFLFRMLADRVPLQPASASNFVRCLHSLSDAEGLFVEEETPNMLLKTRSFTQYISDRLIKELGELPEGSEYRKCFESTFNKNNRCVRCSEQYQSVDERFNLHIAYPTSSDTVPFCTVLEKSLNCPEQSEALCPKCAKTARVTSTRRVRSLANVLVVDTGACNTAEKAFWTAQLHAFEKRPPPKLNTSQSATTLERFHKLCRYGDECKKPFCKYSHSSDCKNEVSSDCEDIPGSPSHICDESDWAHYIPATVYVKVTDGICTVSETRHETSTCLVLRCAVFAIGDGSETEPSHLVTAVRVKPTLDQNNSFLNPATASLKTGKERGWVVFNEFVVTRVTEHEALHVDASWKLPSLLYYVQLDSDNNIVESRATIPPSVFSQEIGGVGSPPEAIFLSEQQIPLKGTLIAIDAEFVAINKEGTRAVGRVSCVREDGSCLLDDYVVPASNDHVSDYLTEWSGIQEADLDPERSKHHLVTLKGTYLKLLHLLQQGVVFVGHGLSSDFNALNIYVPSDQLRDTVHLFYLPTQRMISLQFLAWYLFDENIQQTAHDSVEDARMAFRLYKNYLELKDNGKLQSVIAELYEAGKRLNWKPTGSSANLETMAAAS